MAFRNNAFRKVVLKESNGNLTNAQLLAGLAQEFGEATANAPYLRSAPQQEDDEEARRQSRAARAVRGADRRHVRHSHGGLRQASKNEVKRCKAGGSKKPSDVRALADTVPRMQMLAIQPLDLLPPCAVTFRDYALAVLRTEQVANPTDPIRLSRADARLLHQARHPRRSRSKAAARAGAGVQAAAARRLSSDRVDRRLARRRLSLPRRQPRQAAHSPQRGPRRHRDRARQQAAHATAGRCPSRSSCNTSGARSWCSKASGSAASPANAPRCCAAPPWCSTRTAT